MSAPALFTQGLTKAFGGLVAVNQLDLSVAQGEIHGLIGPNGSGKSTTLNLISGIYHPSAGRIHLAGRDVTHLAAHQRTSLGLARTFQNIRLFNRLTVLENVQVARFCRTTSGLVPTFLRTPAFRREEAETRAQAMTALEWVGLAHLAAAQIGDLPYGTQRLVEIARALALEPVLLMLDEPAAGLNPTEKADLGRLIRRMNRDLNLTVLLIEHDMSLVMNICQKLTVLNFGACIGGGTPAQVRENKQVLEAYLGSDQEEAEVGGTA